MRDNVDQTARLAELIGGKTLRALVGFLADNINSHEILSMHQWIDDRWYIEVVDKRVESHPSSTMVGFSINVNEDKIMWADDPIAGNCWCRSHRWMRIIRKNWPNLTVTRQRTADGNVHDYRNSFNGVKRKKRKPVAKSVWGEASHVPQFPRW